jgi:hypothetical protein
MERYILYASTTIKLDHNEIFTAKNPLETDKCYIFYGKYVNHRSRETSTAHRPIEKGFDLYYSTRVCDNTRRRVFFRGKEDSLVSISGHTYDNNSYLLIDSCFEYAKNTLVSRKLSLIDNVFYCNGVAVNVNNIVVGTVDSYKERNYCNITFDLNLLTVHLDEYAEMLTKNNPCAVELLENVLSKYEPPKSTLEDKLREGTPIQLPISELSIKCLDGKLVYVYPSFFIRYLHNESLFYDKSCEKQEIVTMSKELFWCERLPHNVVSLFFYNLSSSRIPTSKEIVECGDDIECTLRTFCNLSKFFTIDGYDTLYESIYKDMYG